MEELEGIARGADVPLDQLFVLNCGEEFLWQPGPTHGCSNVSIMSNGRVLGQNEDWVADDAGRNVLIKMQLDDGTTILTISAAGYLAATGVNSHGVAIAANTLYSTDNREGVPNSFVCRSMLESRSIDDAIERASQGDRARGSNFHVATAEGDIMDIETTATLQASRWPQTWYAHTNHYLEPALLSFAAPSSEGSRLRLGRAQALVESGLSVGRDALPIVFDILKDHETAPYSICAHPSAETPIEQQEATCASQIWDLEAGVAHICAGLPCENSYVQLPLP
jgi:isopenicillin-N N-acyltransferase-like protein